MPNGIDGRVACAIIHGKRNRYGNEKPFSHELSCISRVVGSFGARRTSNTADPKANGYFLESIECDILRHNAFKNCFLQSMFMSRYGVIVPHVRCCCLVLCCK